MTTTPEHYDVLKDALGTKTADAIVGVAREQAEDVLAGNRAELTELTEKVKSLAAQHGATPEVKEAAKVVADATREHNDSSAKDEPSEADAAKDAERVEQARKVVDGAESDLADQVARHEREVNGEGGIRDRVAALEESHSSLQTAVARAVAIARSGEGGALQHASRVALTVFAIVGVFYWLVWWLTPLDYQWEVNLGLALGAGGLAGWIALVWWSKASDGESSAAASAEAQAGGHHDDGLDIIQPRGAAANADAQSGHGRSEAGANASAH